MSGSYTRLLLIRHGATAANEQRPYILQGNGINGPLSEKGEAQAKSVSEFLSQTKIDAIYCSPLVRAQQTATEIARPHGIAPTPIEGIHEVNVGLWEGQSWEAIMESHPEEYKTFINASGEIPYLGGESYQDVLNRSKPVIEGLVEKHPGETVVIVAHNVVNRAYLADIMNKPINEAKAIRQVNTCVNIIRYQENDRELDTLNSYLHLTEDLVL
ncbi:Phosphoserine phosphatase 1 [Polystyrenella longa]|uniref:Phosphoserine phosphatase 1 n=1 Tax=Polystyrenella longa TaxID=2528007 RepID=A0A518CPR7_9PLAN|nr:histidine phosphatase family protein [Polystyrenella longa]QDU81221.1 Phosphoserine phosphatase 1 [Polystyrenella longa]